MSKNKKRNKRWFCTNMTNPDERQVKYWQDRAESEYLAGEKQGLELAKSLQKNYKECLKQIKLLIEAFYR